VRHQVQVAGDRRVAADDRPPNRLGGDDGIGVHALGVVAHHVGHGLGAHRLQHGRQRDAKPGRQLGLAGEGQHRALGVQEVELRVGLEQHQVAQEAGELFRMPLVQLEQVVVHGDHAAEKGVGPVVGGLVLEALEGVEHRRRDAQRGERAGDEDRERDLEADGHAGRVLIVIEAPRASCTPRP
jgi:hypothetical protein